jgi:hypothetical protein
LEECGPCPVFARITLAFALQLRKKHGKTSVRVDLGDKNRLEKIYSALNKILSAYLCKKTDG